MPLYLEISFSFIIMAESNVQALEKIFTEVDESQIKIIFSSQCIKAQAFLVDKLKKQTKHQKEICNFISSGNIKLDAEIKLAEQELKNLIVSHETIKLGNIELRKEWLLKQSEKLEIIERTNTGEKKYEQLWLESKSRFESIPFVQKYLQVKNRSKIIQDNISNLMNESVRLLCEIKLKKESLLELDQKMAIDLATFLVKEQPKIINSIQSKMKEIKELNTEITVLEDKNTKSTYSKLKKGMEIQQKQPMEGVSYDSNKIDNNWPTLSKNENEILLMPKLQLQGMDFDILSVKLDQIRRVDFDTEHQNETTMIDGIKNKSTESKMSETCSSIYFNNIAATLNQDSQNKNYSNRKLIHILKDVKLDKNQTLQIISELDPNQLCNINAIRKEISEVQESEIKVSEPLLIKKDNIHDCKKNEILVPPTQFLDERKSSQEQSVSFDISMEVTDFKETEHGQSSIHEHGKTNELLNSQDASFVCDEGSGKTKDKILNEDNLDLSQQFVYNEHSILHKMTEDNLITSKFFGSKSNNNNESSNLEEKHCNDESRINPEPQNATTAVKDSSDVKMDETVLPKNSQNDENIDIPVTGFLFNHGSQGVPDSLNLSESTMGLEEVDGEFRHCIDSNILLSPKADVTLEVTDNVQMSSQELPNFMTGVRKTGFSFFGWSSTDSKPKCNVQNADGNFNFNFVGEEKKGRGGLFNIFK